MEKVKRSLLINQLENGGLIFDRHRIVL